MRGRNRRGALKVRDGRVQRKNHWVVDKGDYHAWRQDEIRLDRRDPGPGFRHVLTIPQLRRFLELLAEWELVPASLDAIVLDRGSPDGLIGWYLDGVIGLCAWPMEDGYRWVDVCPEWVARHATVLERLEVHVEKRGPRRELHWTENQARAYMLLDVFPHELGHHVDRLMTRSRRRPARGEPYAEDFALRVLEAVWPVYGRHFAL
jgi:hypothetical protein